MMGFGKPGPSSSNRPPVSMAMANREYDDDDNDQQSDVEMEAMRIEMNKLKELLAAKDMQILQ